MTLHSVALNCCFVTDMEAASPLSTSCSAADPFSFNAGNPGSKYSYQCSWKEPDRVYCANASGVVVKEVRSQRWRGGKRVVKRTLQ